MYKWYDSINGEWMDTIPELLSRAEAIQALDEALAQETGNPEYGRHVHDSDHYLANPEDEDDIVDLTDWRRAKGLPPYKS